MAVHAYPYGERLRTKCGKMVRSKVGLPVDCTTCRKAEGYPPRTPEEAQERRREAKKVIRRKRAWDMVLLYRQGKSLRDIARQLGISDTTVREHLNLVGEALRGRGGPNHKAA